MSKKPAKQFAAVQCKHFSTFSSTTVNGWIKIGHVDDFFNAYTSIKKNTSLELFGRGGDEKIFFTIKSMQDKAEEVYDEIKKTLVKDSTEAVNWKPPRLAESLLILFAPKRQVKHLVDDQREKFARYCWEFDRDYAVAWYWRDTRDSLWPLLWRAICKVIKWGVIIDWARRKAGL